MGRQQFTREETKVAVGVFYEVLFGVVPEHRLNDCYVHVKRNRTTTFALVPEEMTGAWSVIKASEMYKRAPESRQISIGFCAKCNNTGTEVIRQSGYEASRPCTH